ncbi:hypothetical protein NT6N_36080 [Oceaniferula spumae]|uniref:Ice-binding protein C-terminal domain-containing protein n=1 Tax=Oceaniferula spumae TaxID=2979115 RepID=A0AAT9FRF5_9BACT
MKIKTTLAVIAATTMASQAVTIFSDDFESYPTGDPADFSGTGNWTHNGAGAPANQSRIFFSAPNFGGTTLWISSEANALAGSGLDSRAITQGGDGLLANTDYIFSGAIVLETFSGLRTHDFTVDILSGSTLGSATSLIGGPQTFTARGDHDAGITGSIDDSYDDQRTTVAFNSGSLGAGDAVFMQIAFTNVNNDGGFVGIDEITIDSVPEPSSAALLGLGGLALILRRRK